MVSTTARTRKAAGRCVTCGRRPPRVGLTQCAPCSLRQSRRKQIYNTTHGSRLRAQATARREAAWTQPGPNLIACCAGQFHPVDLCNVNMVRLRCCGRIFATQKETP